MKKHRDLTLLVPILAALALLGAGHEPLAIRGDGIVFPDGTVLQSAAGSLANVVIVAKSGGHHSSIQEALDAIQDAGPDNPYLVWVAPGVYEEQVTMREWVSIQGAGEGITKIRQGGHDDLDGGEIVVHGADNAELRDLTVENGGGGALAVAIYNESASPRLSRVTAAVSGAQQSIAVLNSESSPTMTRVTARSHDGFVCTAIVNGSSSPGMIGVVAEAADCLHNKGIDNAGSSAPRMTDVVARATGGAMSWAVFNHDSAAPTMLHLTAEASGGGSENLSLYVSDVSSARTSQSSLDGGVLLTSESLTVFAHTLLAGEVVGTEYNCACLGSYKGDLEPLDPYCQPFE